MRRGVLIALFMSTLGNSGPARADVAGALLPKGAIDVGVFYRKLDRTVESGNEKDSYQSGWSLFMGRVGVTETLTAAVELSSGLGSNSGDDYTYVVGAALQTRMWMHDRMRATTRIGYRRSLLIARSTGNCDYLEQGIDWSAQFEHEFDIKNQEFTWWAGPTLSFLRADPEPPCNAGAWESSKLFGLIGGTTVVVGRGVVLSAQGTWIDSFEYSLLVAYRF